jgi:hypothetical protein
MKSRPGIQIDVGSTRGREHFSAGDRRGANQTEDGLPEDVRLELGKGNLVRAAHLALQQAVPRERVRELQSNAVRQFIELWHNFEGAKQLISSYGLNDDEVRTIVRQILENPRSHTESMTWFNRKKGRMVASTFAAILPVPLRFAICATEDCFGLKLTRDSPLPSPSGWSTSGFVTSARPSMTGKTFPASLMAATDCGDADRKSIRLVDRRGGLLLSRLGFAQAGHGTGAVFFG